MNRLIPYWWWIGIDVSAAVAEVCTFGVLSSSLYFVISHATWIMFHIKDRISFEIWLQKWLTSVIYGLLQKYPFLNLIFTHSCPGFGSTPASSEVLTEAPQLCYLFSSTASALCDPLVGWESSVSMATLSSTDFLLRRSRLSFRFGKFSEMDSFRVIVNKSQQLHKVDTAEQEILLQNGHPVGSATLGVLQNKICLTVVSLSAH